LEVKDLTVSRQMEKVPKVDQVAKVDKEEEVKVDKKEVKVDKEEVKVDKEVAKVDNLQLMSN